MKTIQKARLNLDEFNTTIIEMENTLKSRPLYLSDENFQYSITTHLLYGRNINQRNPLGSVNPQLVENDIRVRLDHLRMIISHFQTRFYKEYVALRERDIYITQIKNMIIIVILKWVTFY